MNSNHHHHHNQHRRHYFNLPYQHVNNSFHPHHQQNSQQMGPANEIVKETKNEIENNNNIEEYMEETSSERDDYDDDDDEEEDGDDNGETKGECKKYQKITNLDWATLNESKYQLNELNRSEFSAFDVVFKNKLKVFSDDEIKVKMLELVGGEDCSKPLISFYDKLNKSENKNEAWFDMLLSNSLMNKSFSKYARSEEMANPRSFTLAKDRQFPSSSNRSNQDSPMGKVKKLDKTINLLMAEGLIELNL